MEYYIKRLGRLAFSVAKFDDTDSPTEVYRVQFSKLSLTGRCECLGFRHMGQYDKHLQMVNQWLDAGEPYPKGFQL